MLEEYFKVVREDQINEYLKSREVNEVVKLTHEGDSDRSFEEKKKNEEIEQ